MNTFMLDDPVIIVNHPRKEGQTYTSMHLWSTIVLTNTKLLLSLSLSLAQQRPGLPGNPVASSSSPTDGKSVNQRGIDHPELPTLSALAAQRQCFRPPWRDFHSEAAVRAAAGRTAGPGNSLRDAWQPRGCNTAVSGTKEEAHCSVLLRSFDSVKK